VLNFWSKEGKRTGFYTLTRWGIGRRRWIGKRGVSGKACPPVFHRVVALQQHGFAGLQVREIEPALLRIIGDRIDLARPLLVYQVGRDQVLLFYTGGITHGQGLILGRDIDRPPDIVHTKSVLQERFGLFGREQVSDTGGAGSNRIVVVGKENGRANSHLALLGSWPTSHVVIKHHDF